MTIRSTLVAVALIALAADALAQSDIGAIAVPALRPHVTVTSDIVRIGDVIDNAGPAAQIAIYRAPDLGTTGTLQAEQIVTALRNHRVIGVDTRDIREVSVTRASRVLSISDIERAVGLALERRNGLGDAADLSLTFDRDVRMLQLDAGFTGEPNAVAVRFEPRGGRFDITLEVGNNTGATPARLRLSGTAVETIQVTVSTRNVERNELLKAADIVTERRPKTEAGVDLASRERSVGMQARKAIRAGQPIRGADLGKPDIVQRDQSVTLFYEVPGISLTVRGKAMDAGAEGDVVNVMNLQSKRAVQGSVIGPGQILIAAPAARVIASAAPAPSAPIADVTGTIPDATPAAAKAE